MSDSTEDARQAIFWASLHQAYEARSSSIETDHLLAGLLGADPQLAQRFPQLIAFVPASIAGVWPPTPEPVPRRDLPLSHESKHVLWPMPPKKASVGGTGTSARSTSCSDLREPDSRAARVLREAGLELTALRAQIAKLTSNVSEEAKVGEQDLHRKAGRRRGQQLERLSYPRRSLAAGPCPGRRLSRCRDAYQARSDGRAGESFSRG